MKRKNPICGSLKPEYRLEAVAGVAEIGRLGSRAACEGGGGSSLVHKACKGLFVKDFIRNYLFPLENAHASINLHSVKKAKHILRKFL